MNPHTAPRLATFDSFAVGPGLPVLLVYGDEALAAARVPNSELHWYVKVALPEHTTPEDEQPIALSLCKLAARAVVIWPPQNEAGLARAKRDAALIACSGAIAVGVVTAPIADLADVLPPGTPKFVFRGAADTALAAARARTLAPLAGRTAQAVPPWLGQPAIAQVFDEACAFLRRYLAEPLQIVETIALWCLHAWCTRAGQGTFDVSPRLILNAIDPRADHARALRLIAWLTPAPLTISRTIASHVLAAIEADKPTLLIDDVAGGTLYRRDMRTLIAAGAYRDGVFLTARNKRNETGRGQCFAPTAVATATALPEDVRLRSIVVPMAPPPMGDARARLNQLDPPMDAFELRAKMQAAAATITDNPSAFATLPRSLSTTARENWSPLMTLALSIGADAATRVAESAVLLTASAPPAASNLALLRDIRDLGVVSAGTRIASNDLLQKLTADPERAWATAHCGRPITPRHLADRLANFGVRPCVMRLDDGRLTRGYRCAPLIDAFARYLSDLAPSEDILEGSDA